MDESQPARMTVADGHSTTEGFPSGYVQDLARPILLAGNALRFVGGYASRDGRLDDIRRIEADARIVDGGLRRPGREGTATRLRLTLRPLLNAGEESRLLLLIGWREDASDMPAFAEAFVPSTVFEALKADLLAGLAHEVSLSATTSLWLRERDRDRPVDASIDRYLGPDGDGAGSMPARGFVEKLEWSAPPQGDMAAASSVSESVPQPIPPVHVPAAGDVEEEEAVADELRRINWSFRQFLILLAFLLIILAIK